MTSWRMVAGVWCRGISVAFYLFVARNFNPWLFFTPQAKVRLWWLVQFGPRTQLNTAYWTPLPTAAYYCTTLRRYTFVSVKVRKLTVAYWWWLHTLVLIGVIKRVWISMENNDSKRNNFLVIKKVIMLF